MKQFFKFAFASALGVFMAITVIFSLSLFAIIAIISQTEEKTFTLKPTSVLHIELKGEIVERSEQNPFGEIFSDYKVQAQGLDDILSAIDKAENQADIKGIFLDFNFSNAGLATYEEIRERLKEFKKSGKFIAAYSNMYSQKEYFLASVADSIFINPVGTIDFRGLGGEPMFFKNALDKLGIEMQIFKVGTYKSAVEPFTNEKMSDANRAQVTEYMNGLWDHILISVSNGRKISVDSLKSYADQGMMFSSTENIVKMKFADKVLYRSDLWSHIQKMAKSDIEKEENGLVSVTDIQKIETPSNDANDIVAMVYAAGGIDDGSSDGVNSEKLSKELAKIKKDSTVKAVVLRVNSPGGSAFGSEQIWHEIAEINKTKPVIVSMGDYAASGGYYISCPATAIVAQPTTITGSIGIFGMLPNVSKLTDKLGITFDEVSTNKFANTPSVNHAMRADEKMLFQSFIERGYDLFVTRCADGRKVTKEKIETVAQGHVWTGEKALQIGLVDKLGGIQTAIKLAVKKAKLKNYRVEDYPRKKEFYEKIMEDISAETSTALAKLYFGESFKYYITLKNLEHQNPVQARIPFVMNIE
ncbi:MAG: signal peptide peptidase SppA [Bacteroidales bacterium]|nr:signal peptide peptidase SppA [Bacteroidales bacterium]